MKEIKLLGLYFAITYDSFFIYFTNNFLKKKRINHLEIVRLAISRKYSRHNAKFQLILWRKV